MYRPIPPSIRLHACSVHSPLIETVSREFVSRFLGDRELPECGGGHRFLNGAIKFTSTVQIKHFKRKVVP